VTPPTTRDELLARVQRLPKHLRLIRSKDAGPFMLTIDLFCHDADALRRVMDEGGITPSTFSDLYGCDPATVEIHIVEQISAVKISFPRPVASGELADSDITGGQQYALLVEHLAATALGG
jgi:hypothetical protein